MSTASITAINASDYQKYSNPIPSRDFISALIKKSDRPLNRSQLADLLDLSTDEQKEALRRRLRAMERDGQVSFTHRQGYRLVDESELFEGRVIGHSDGFGFLSPADRYPNTPAKKQYDRGA